MTIEYFDRPALKEAMDHLQKVVYKACRDSNWDPNDRNSFPEELTHLHAELSEAFEEWRMYHHCQTYYREDGKPEGVPAEFGDLFIGMLYNAERMGFSLFDGLILKLDWQAQRDYVEEGRQLHA